MIDVQICHEVLCMAPMAYPEAGAVMRFTGVVRPVENEVTISALIYEGYEPMARHVMNQILENLATSHPVDHVRVQHRLGIIPVGEAAIIIEAASKHRGASLGLISAFMDQLKQDVPIWKVRAISL